MDFEGLVWRHVPRGAHPLHVGFILLARGRWNRHDEYGCLYTSLSREGALAEYTKELRRLGIAASADQPKDLVTLNVGVARVLDLTVGIPLGRTQSQSLYRWSGRLRAPTAGDVVAVRSVAK